MMSRIDSWHQKISTGRNFQNGHHNTAHIQHCPISTTFHMWVPNRPQTTSLKNNLKATFEIEQCWIFAVLWRPFWKWRPVDIFRCQESFRDIIIYPHMKCRWNWTMLNLCGIVAADFNDISYVGRLWYPEMIPDIEKFLTVAIFNMAATIPHKFNIVQFQRHFICG
jgi:hypothetical protein